MYVYMYFSCHIYVYVYTYIYIDICIDIDRYICTGRGCCLLFGLYDYSYRIWLDRCNGSNAAAQTRMCRSRPLFVLKK